MAISTLIVSPDPGLVRQVGGILEARGLSVAHVASPAEALDRFEVGRFGLVIAEVDLPGGSGFDLCRTLKASGVDPAVLLLYTVGEGSVERNARDCGANGVLRRPFLASQLLHSLDAMRRPQHADPHAASLVDPATGVFSSSESLPPLSTGDFEALRTSDIDVLDPKTQELPPLAIESFDEEHPVSIPVGSDATAHALPTLGDLLSDDGDSSDDSSDDLPPARGPHSLGRNTGEMATPPSIREAARIRRAVEAEVEEMFRPGGRVATLIEAAVAEAVRAALADR